jgi:hypothetical protein
VRPSARESVEISGRELLNVVDPATDLIPSYITGTLGGRHSDQQDLAVAVNGRIEAVTRSYTEFGSTKFAALVPERALHAGANDVSVFAVFGNVLEELPGSDLAYGLSAGSLVASDGSSVPVGKAIAGEVRGTRNASGSTLGGWAADLKKGRAADRIVVFADGTSVFDGPPGNIARNDIAARYGIAKTGFIFRLPGSLLPVAGPEHEVRVFALGGGVASELRYLRGYPWSTG